MAISVKGSRSENRQSSRADRMNSVSSEGKVSDIDEVAESWRRCTVDYHLNPSSRSVPNVLTETELRISKEPVGRVISCAQEELNRLHAILREAGYVILLCDSEGVAVGHRGDESDAEEFKYWGIWQGGVWSEQIEGTNGIGTCITEERPVIVHCDQHFRTRHKTLSCSAAPIFDADAKLIAVIDSSSFNRESSDRSHELALAATKVSARAVEERLFRESFLYAWNIAAVPSDDSGPAVLLAVDKDQRVIGADRAARSAFSLDDKRLAEGLQLSSLYDHDSTILRKNNGQDIVGRFLETRGAREWRMMITPPACGPRELRIVGTGMLHSRPRINLLGNIPASENSTSNHGGLPPRVANRIHEYIDSHLGENLSLEQMAEMAALSVFHFARAFRQSFGMPPHTYLLHRRVEYANRLLRKTDLGLSEIALSTGFSDQSHLTRHFHRLTGMTPSAVRRDLMGEASSGSSTQPSTQHKHS